MAAPSPLADRRTALRGRLEASLLLVLGLASLAFARGDRYGVLMNPSFRWVTLSGSLLIVAMACALLVRPRRSGNASALLIFIAFLALIVIARPIRDGVTVLAPAVPSAVSLERDGYERFDPEQIFAGFTKENPDLEGRQAIMGGLVKRTPEMDAQGRYALLDPVMACCLADAIAFGVVVDLEGRLPPADAEWVYVYGKLDAPPQPLATPPLRTGTIVFTTVSKQYMLRTHDLVTHRALQADVVEKLPEEQCGLFAKALGSTGFADVLRGEGPFTVFAPLDLSFARSAEGVPDLRRYLEDFVVRGRLTRSDLYDTDSLETLSGRRLAVRATNGRLHIEGARILFSDTMARNGILHIVHPAWAAGQE